MDSLFIIFTLDYQVRAGRARPLRVGFISPDFFVHSVSYFIEATLAHYDADSFFIVCYSNVVREDAKTQHLRRFPQVWRAISGLGAKNVADLIRDDRIDILVELTGCVN